MVGGHGASANAHELSCIQYHMVISVHKTNEVSNLLKEEGVKDIISNENCKIREEDTLPHSKLFWQFKGIHKTIRFLFIKYRVQLKTPRTLNGTAAVWSDSYRKWTGLVRRHRETCLSLWLLPIYSLTSGSDQDGQKGSISSFQPDLVTWPLVLWESSWSHSARRLPLFYSDRASVKNRQKMFGQQDQ